MSLAPSDAGRFLVRRPAVFQRAAALAAAVFFLLAAAAPADAKLTGPGQGVPENCNQPNPPAWLNCPPPPPPGLPAGVELGTHLDPAAQCGFLNSLWCRFDAGTPAEVLERELEKCETYSEAELKARGYFRTAPVHNYSGSYRGSIPGVRIDPAVVQAAWDRNWSNDVVHMRARCVSEMESQLAKLTAPQGWFNSDEPPRSSAGYTMELYHMHWSTGFWASMAVVKPMMGVAAEFTWKVGVTFLRVAAWAFDWAVGGKVTGYILGLPEYLAGEIQSKVVHRLGLYGIALTMLAAVVGWHLVRRRLAEAAGELGFAVVAFAVVSVMLVWSWPGSDSGNTGYYSAAVNVRRLLGEGMTFGPASPDGGEPGTAAAVMRPVIDAAIHTPWEHLNFGGPLTTECQVKAGRDILLAGAGTSGEGSVDALRNCDGGAAMADFASNPSTVRVWAVFLVVAGQVAVAFLVFATAALVLISEVMLAAAFACLPLLAVGVLFPAGRRAAGAWFGLFLKGLTGYAAGMLFLSLVMIVVIQVINKSVGATMIERSLLFLMVALAGVKLRKLLPAAAAQVSANLGGQLSAAVKAGTKVNSAPLLAAGGGLAGGALAQQLLSPGRAAQKLARAGSRGLAGAKQGLGGLAATASAAAYQSKTASGGQPGKLLSALNTMSSNSKAGQGPGVVRGAVTQGAASLAGKLADGRARRAASSLASKAAGAWRGAGAP